MSCPNAFIGHPLLQLATWSNIVDGFPPTARGNDFAPGSQLIAMRVITQSGSALYFLSSDHLGSTSLTTNANGGFVARQLYDAWGNVRYVSGAMPTDISFTGQRADSTGLYFYGARFYSPVSGRFVSADTIVAYAKNPQSLNRFTYVNNSPINRIDPSGNCDVNADHKTDPCWQLLEKLQDTWGLKFFNTDLWTPDYLQYLSDTFNGMANLIGGESYLKFIITASAHRANHLEFYIYGAGDCQGGAACSNYGQMTLPLKDIFSPKFETWGPMQEYYYQQDNQGKVIMGHELGHAVLGIAEDIDQAYRSYWTQINFFGITTFWTREYKMYPDPGENLVQLMGIYITGNGWQHIDYTQNRQLSTEDFVTINNLKVDVPKSIVKNYPFMPIHHQ